MLVMFTISPGVCSYTYSYIRLGKGRKKQAFQSEGCVWQIYCEDRISHCDSYLQQSQLLFAFKEAISIM